MRKIILLLVLVALIAGALAVFLVATTPRSPIGVRFPLASDQRELLAAVPADADTFALIPTAAAMHARLRANPVTRTAVEEWMSGLTLPPPWLIGRADLLIWRSPAGTSYAFRLDPLRALLLRGYFMVGRTSARLDGSRAVFGPAQTGPRLSDGELDALLRLGSAQGDALVIQRKDAQMFPPIRRPALSTVTVQPREILIVSAAPSGTAAPETSRRVILPRRALLSSWFGEPPRLVADIDRLLPGDVSALLSDGGSVVLYEVESRRLLPRFRGLFVIPETPEARLGAGRLATVADLLGEVAYRDGNILISFDRSSLGAYAAEQFDELPFPASSWALRIDAEQMLPTLERLGDNTGLRLGAPRLHRSVRDLRVWIGHMRDARLIEAALADEGEKEELRVRITAK